MKENGKQNILNIPRPHVEINLTYFLTLSKLPMMEFGRLLLKEFIIFSIPSGETIHYPFTNTGEIYRGEFDRISGLLDDQGKIYVGLGNNIYVLDTRVNEPSLEIVESFYHLSKPSVSITRDLLFDSPDVFLIPSYRNLALFDLKNEQLSLIQEEKKVSKNLFNDPVKITYKDKQGNYWIGTAGGGLFLGQNLKSAFTYYQNDPANPSSISEGQVRSFLEDEHGNLWVGIINHGMDYLSTQPNGLLKKTKSILALPNQSNSLASDRIIKIIRGDDKCIWGSNQ